MRTHGRLMANYDGRKNHTAHQLLLCHTHTARTGGTFLTSSLMHDLTLYQREGCMHSVRKSCSSEPSLFSVLVRSPRDHVLSLYLECAYSNWGLKHM